MVWTLLFLGSGNNPFLCILTWLSWESASCFRGFRKSLRKARVLIYAVDTKYIFYVWRFFQLPCVKDLNSFQYQLKIPDACLFVWKVPETATFNSLTWVVYVWVFHWVVFSAFSLLCGDNFLYWCTRVPVCLPPPASVLPLGLGKRILCSGLLCQRFDSSPLLALSLFTVCDPGSKTTACISETPELRTQKTLTVLDLHWHLCLVHPPKGRLCPRLW